MKLRRLPLACGLAMTLLGHPMGNYSVSHYTRIEVGRGGASLLYALDLAEIPTFELLRQWGLDRNSPKADLDRRAAEQAREWAGRLKITVNGREVRPRFLSADLTVTDGAGGIPVARIAARLALPVAPGKLEFEDRNYAERAGWKEIVIAAKDGAGLTQTSHGDLERSQALTAYPQDPTVAPPQDLRASLEWTLAPVAAGKRVESPKPVVVTPPSPVATAATPPGQNVRGTVVRGDYLSQLLRSGNLSSSMILLGLAVAFGLGAVHALSPGHGKTIVAAYLVGARGTARHAVFLGGMVTFTHTISVFFLGFTTLFLSEYVSPDTLTPILATISGVSIVWIGLTLLIQRTRKLVGHSHPHDHDHHHGPGGHTHVPEGEITLTSLIALGASGGLVPCPSALVLLLSSIAIHRTGLGILLLLAFSAGLAAVLTAIGLAVLYAAHWLPDREKSAAHPAFRLLPVVSAGIITCVGLVMTGVALGIIQPSRILG